MDLLPGAERAFTATGGTYSDPDGEWVIVLHSTEGSTIEAAGSAFTTHKSHPHLTVDLHRRRIVQHIVFSQSARALKNLAGGVETNRQKTIQIEIVGFAKVGVTSDVEDLHWFGRAVLGPLMQAFDIPATFPTFYGEGAGWVVATASARQRFSATAWRTFRGICGHQHVPENDHWDPGPFPIAIALAGITPTDHEEDPLAGYTLEQIGNAVWDAILENKYQGKYKARDILAALDQHVNVAAADTITARDAAKGAQAKLNGLAKESAQALLDTSLGDVATIDKATGAVTGQSVPVGYALRRAAEASVTRWRDELGEGTGTAEARLEKALRVIDAQAQAIQALTSGKSDLVSAVQHAVNGAAA